MLTREERFFEVAACEVASNQLSQSAWGKAFSLTAGDEQKAKALYIKLRVDQLERDYQQSIGYLICELQSEIISGKPFVCPYCENRAAAKKADVDFLKQLFTGADRYQYYCATCRIELKFNNASEVAKHSKA